MGRTGWTVSEGRGRTIHLVALVTCLAAAGLAAVFLVRAANRSADGVLVEAGLPVARAVMMGVVALMLAAVVAFRPQSARSAALGRTAAAWTVILLAGLVGLWAVTYVQFDFRALSGTRVSSETEVASFLANHPPPAGRSYEIPTGLFLQQFEFLSGDNVLVAGHVWQRYDDAVPPEIERRVIFPESIDTEVFELDAEVDLGEATLYDWYFEVTLRQAFDYAHYPLDRQDIWFRLWSPSADLGAVLVPDFASYQDIAPDTLPGIDNDLVASGWVPDVSGFSYKLHSYNTRFGQVDQPFLERTPELYFNLGIKRDYRGPLLKHIPFTLAIAGLLFGILILATNDPTLRDRFGFETLAVIATTGALLLTVVVEHNGMRDTVSAGQVSYIEVLPFTLYGLILLVTVNAVVRDQPNAPAFFDDRHNNWPVLLYWPFFFGVLFAVTYVVFF